MLRIVDRPFTVPFKSCKELSPEKSAKGVALDVLPLHAARCLQHVLALGIPEGVSGEHVRPMFHDAGRMRTQIAKAQAAAPLHGVFAAVGASAR